MIRLLAPTALLALIATACSSTPDQASGDPDGESTARIVVLQHLQTNDAVEALMGLEMPYQVTISEGTQSNSLLIRGDSTSVDRVLRFIATIDKPGR